MKKLFSHQNLIQPFERISMIKFSHVIYYIKDIEGTLKFYQNAFGITSRYVHESGSYAELETGAVALAFVTENMIDTLLPNGYYKNDPTKVPAGCEIVFTSNNVQETFENALKAGATQVAAPEVKPWGQTVAYVRDPEGILVEIASVMA